MLDELINPKPIQAILDRNGNLSVRKTDKSAEILKFEKNWSILYGLFYKNPFLRLIFYYFIHEIHFKKTHQFIDINSIVIDFIDHENNIKKSLKDFPLEIEVCPNCRKSNIINKRLRGKHRYYCGDCKHEFNNPELVCSFSVLGHFDIYEFINELVNAKILAKTYQSTCYDCMDVNHYPDENDAKKNVLCSICAGLKDIVKVYTLVESLNKMENLDSIWLEWYALKIICENCENIVSILPTHKISGEGINTEIDLILLTQNKKLISIDCKAKIFKSKLSKDNINQNILDWKRFSDYVLIVTNAEISTNCKDFWSTQIRNIKFIDGKNLEKLNECISEL